MLCQITIDNYKCFRDSATLDLQATNISEHDDSLLISKDGERFLPLAVIYGPNGSGKSTILEALYSLTCKIMRPIYAVNYEAKAYNNKNKSFDIVPFRLSKASINKPTNFELFFRTKIAEYQYNVSILHDKIVYEELNKKNIDGQRYSQVFFRNNNKIELKSSLKEYNCNGISDDLTLLSFFGITHRRNNIIKDVIDWFENQFQYINYGNPFTESQVLVSKSLKPLILKMLEEMDVDISDYRIEKKDDEIDVFTSHQIDNETFELKLEEESSGSIKLFGILPYIADSLKSGSTLIIDELDAKIHPTLLKYIISLFSNPNINKHQAQLIFTSHDLSTMNSSVFRRDEIWFVAKGVEQNSVLYSLVEIKSDGTAERKDNKYSKRYLEGKYGADPYLRKIINWEDE